MSPLPPPPPPPSQPAPPGDDDLVSVDLLAAGHLTGPQADALRARLAQEAPLARAAAEARALEQLFQAERFYPCPPALLARIVAEHVELALAPWQRVLAFVASALLAVGALFAFTAPTSAVGPPLLPPPPGPGPLELFAPPGQVLPDVPSAFAALAGPNVAWILLGGALLLTVGWTLARRMKEAR